VCVPYMDDVICTGREDANGEWSGTWLPAPYIQKLYAYHDCAFRTRAFRVSPLSSAIHFVTDAGTLVRIPRRGWVWVPEPRGKCS
jgi:hypothetical protein